MKRFFTLLVCLVMIFSLVACGKNTAEETTAPSTGESAELKETEGAASDATVTVPEETAPDATVTDPDETEATQIPSGETVPQKTEPTEDTPVDTKPQATKPTEPSHTHSHKPETVNATCEKDGYIRYICSCGDISSETKLSKRSHSWKSASCAAPKTCYNCGATEGDALPHSWKEATYAYPKTCRNCQTTEGSALAGPTIKVGDSFPKDYYYYSRSFTVNSCEATFGTDSLGTSRYIKITMNVTRTSDSTPTAGKLALKVNVYDANGTLVKQDSIWSDELPHNTSGLMTASIPLPKSSESGSYTITFTESY